MTAPLFTVIVATYNRLEALEQCLLALVAQELPRDRFEIVVVDDGSTVSPRALVDGFQGALDIQLLQQTNAGPAAARNAGAAVARGAYLAFTDDDCLPDTRWLGALAVAVQQHAGCAIGGRVDNALGDGIYSTASQLLVDFLYEYYNATTTENRFFVTMNVAFPTAEFRELGGFNVTFPLAAAEDRDMCDRWTDGGHVMVYVPAAIVRHAHALELGSFCRQHFNYGRGAHHLRRARARRGASVIKIEPLHFYWRLVCYPLSKASGVMRWNLSALLFLSQGTYVSGYLFERITGRVLSPMST